MACDHTTADLRARNARMSFIRLLAWNSGPSIPNQDESSVTNLRPTPTKLQYLPTCCRPTPWARLPRLSVCGDDQDIKPTHEYKTYMRCIWIISLRDKTFKSDLCPIDDRKNDIRGPHKSWPICKEITIERGSTCQLVTWEWKRAFHDRFWRLKTVEYGRVTADNWA